jgi:hypothetical protein
MEDDTVIKALSSPRATKRAEWASLIAFLVKKHNRGTQLALALFNQHPELIETRNFTKVMGAMLKGMRVWTRYALLEADAHDFFALPQMQKQSMWLTWLFKIANRDAFGFDDRARFLEKVLNSPNFLTSADWAKSVEKILNICGGNDVIRNAIHAFLVQIADRNLPDWPHITNLFLEDHPIGWASAILTANAESSSRLIKENPRFWKTRLPTLIEEVMPYEPAAFDQERMEIIKHVLPLPEAMANSKWKSWVITILKNTRMPTDELVAVAEYILQPQNVNHEAVPELFNELLNNFISHPFNYTQCEKFIPQILKKNVVKKSPLYKELQYKVRIIKAHVEEAGDCTALLMSSVKL